MVTLALPLQDRTRMFTSIESMELMTVTGGNRQTAHLLKCAGGGAAVGAGIGAASLGAGGFIAGPGAPAAVPVCALVGAGIGAGVGAVVGLGIGLTDICLGRR
jgi:hypothetical protein